MNARRWSALSFGAALAGLFAASCAAEGDTPDADGPVASASAPLLGADNPAAIAGHYIVVFKPEAPAAARGQAAARVGARGTGRVERTYEVIPGFAAELAPADLAELRRDPNVAFIEQDQVVTASTIFDSPADGVDRVDQRNLPLDGKFNDFGCTGAGVDVYIVDTGIRPTHNEFTGRIGNGFSAINDGRGSDDCNGHGTHVASTAAGTQFGLAKKATLHASRVLGCNGSGTNSGVIAGVDFVRTDCTSKGRKCVANMSLGGGASTALDNAVTNAINAGIAFAVAAGNENQNACNVSPARAPAAITVAATADNDARASFSNFGSCVDLFAPGVSILGAAHTSNTATQSISGTSMASPHVAGAAAQFLSCNLSANPTQVRNALLNNATLNCVTGVNGSPNILLHNNFTAGTFTCGGGGGGTPDNSCVNRCDLQAPAGCFCDDQCAQFGDCCPDKVATCG
ncbi:MAG TPA: S8 family serine peptidase [Polyangiaceae bacterium]|nr:S8 family serine peptidase [Polyangiaceae bacterium]